MSEHQKNERWMVRWTAVLSVFTIILAVATTLSAYFIFEQLGEMRSSSEQVERSIAVSSKIADTANRALVDVQRAFLFVDEIKVTPDFDINKNFIAWNYAPILRNSGNTPALNVRYIVLDPHSDLMARPLAEAMQVNHLQYYEWSAKISAPQDPDPILTAPEMGNKPYITNAGPIGPKSETPISNVFSDIHVAAEEISNADALSNKIGRFIFGSIQYDDIFGKSHLTKFCFALDGISINHNGILPIPPHRCRHWNCTDKEECDKDKAEYRL